MQNLNFGTISAKIAEQLRADIISGYYKANERITIKDVADRFGVSFMPVREAFQTLKGEKFIDIVPYKGAIVMSGNQKYVEDIMEMHAMLQAEYSARVCKNGVPPATRAAIDEAHRRIDEFSGAPNDPEFLSLDLEFHRLFITDCGNEKVLEEYSQYTHLFLTLRSRYSSTASRMERIKKEHGDIMNRLVANDPDGLREAIYRHKLRSILDVIKIMQAE